MSITNVPLCQSIIFLGTGRVAYGRLDNKRYDWPPAKGHTGHGKLATDRPYRQISDIRGTKSLNLNVSRLVLQLVVFAQSIEARC